MARSGTFVALLCLLVSACPASSATKTKQGSKAAPPTSISDNGTTRVASATAPKTEARLDREEEVIRRLLKVSKAEGLYAEKLEMTIRNSTDGQLEDWLVKVEEWETRLGAKGEVEAPSTAPGDQPDVASVAPESSAVWPDLAGPQHPVGGGEKDAALVVGIEDYAFVADVPGARQNAKDWYRYFTKVRGVSPGNVKLLLDQDATDNGMRKAVDDLAQRVGEGGTIWFVFVGHGAPSEDQKDGLLVGVDAQQSAIGLYGRSVSQRSLIDAAAIGKQGRTVFIVDACFSGRASDGAALASGLQPLMPVQQQVKDRRTMVFSAATSSQFAGPLPGLGRPAFSYLMLGGLLGWSDVNADGVVSSAELLHYSRDTLSAVLNDRSQTPEMFPARDEDLGKSAGLAAPDVAGIVLGE